MYPRRPVLPWTVLVFHISETAPDKRQGRSNFLSLSLLIEYIEAVYNNREPRANIKQCESPPILAAEVVLRE